MPRDAIPPAARQRHAAAFAAMLDALEAPCADPAEAMAALAAARLLVAQSRALAPSLRPPRRDPPPAKPAQAGPPLKLVA
jgi:hypothetical protein